MGGHSDALWRCGWRGPSGDPLAQLPPLSRHSWILVGGDAGRLNRVLRLIRMFKLAKLARMVKLVKVRSSKFTPVRTGERIPGL